MKENEEMGLDIFLVSFQLLHLMMNSTQELCYSTTPSSA